MQVQPCDGLRQLFAEQDCWLIEDLAKRLQYATVSVRRFLKQVRYFRSYTHNGKWYTLCSIPAFNAQGIWVHEEIGFSKHGSLIRTIAHLVQKSPTGLSARDLVEILHHPCHAVLTNLYKAEQLDRIKVGPAFVYLALDQGKNQRQRKRLQTPILEQPPQTLTADAAICVLVEFIRHPSSSFDRLAQTLHRRQKIVVPPEIIERFFQDQHIKKRTIRRLRDTRGSP